MLKYWWLIKKDKLQLWFAYRLPKWLVIWATIRLLAQTTSGQYESTIVSELTVMEALRRFEEGK